MRAKVFAVWASFVLTLVARADLVVMQNGDHYHGKVLSVTATNVVLQSDMVGVVTLSRAKVANVTVGTNVTANPPVATLPTKSNTVAEVSPVLRELAAHTNLIQRVQSQFLAAAGPEANEKFSQLLSDLTSGKMTLADLRAQARDAADQLRALQRESGEDAGVAADLYLSILDRFLQDGGAADQAVTNSTKVR